MLASALGVNPFAQPILFPFWYMRCLMILVCLSPIIVWLLKKLGVWYFVLLAPLYLYACGICYRYDRFPFLFYSPFSLAGFFYFGLGIWLRGNRIDVAVLSKHRLWVGLFGFACILGGNMSGIYSLRGCLWIVGIPPLLYAVWGITKRMVLPVWLCRSAIVVYAFHMFVLLMLKNVSYLNGGSAWAYVTRALLAIGCAVGVDVAMRGMMPRAWAIVTGGR